MEVLQKEQISKPNGQKSTKANPSLNQTDGKPANQLGNNPKKPTQNIKPIKYNNPKFKFDNETVQRLFFKKLDIIFLKDLSQHCSVYANRNSAASTLKSYFIETLNLEDAARLSHEIIEDFTLKCPEPKVPRILVLTFIEILIKNKEKIRHLLDPKKGDKLLDFVPLEFLVGIIELYDLKLSQKDANIFFRQLSDSKNFSDIPKFIVLNSHQDFSKQLTTVIKRLISEKQYKKLRMIPNLREIFRENPVLVQEKNKMLRNTAFYQFKSEGWQYLEEIFQFHPGIIAMIINSNFGYKPTKFQNQQNYFEGVVSICQRNPKILERLKPDTKKVILDKKAEMLKNGKSILLNALRVDKFQPSNQTYFSFSQFQITVNNVIWVDDKLQDSKLKQIKKQLLEADRIAIDTESTLVRTPIDLDLDVLSLIQVSTDNKIYLFDPYNSKHPQIKATFKEYFSNKKKLVIGHTIQDDIGGIAHFYGLPQPVCKVIDIKIEYEKFAETKKQVSLKAISKQILGKQICKKYTMTNWDRRPLNLCQIHYAAMDAFIILKIWDKLCLQIQEKKINPQKYKKVESKSEELLDVAQKEKQVLVPEEEEQNYNDKVTE